MIYVDFVLHSNSQFRQNQSPGGTSTMCKQSMWNHLITHCWLSHKIILPNDVRRQMHHRSGEWRMVLVPPTVSARAWRRPGWEFCGFLWLGLCVFRRLLTRSGNWGFGRVMPIILRAHVMDRVTATEKRTIKKSGDMLVLFGRLFSLFIYKETWMARDFFLERLGF